MKSAADLLPCTCHEIRLPHLFPATDGHLEPCLKRNKAIIAAVQAELDALHKRIDDLEAKLADAVHALTEISSGREFFFRGL